MIASMRTLTVALFVALAAARLAWAQPTAPIYAQYDGYVKRPGGYVLSFGYFNQHNVDVTLDPGDANGFTPGPADRNQPVRFAKGRHRFSCVMLVDRTFDGKLQWSVKFAGKVLVAEDNEINQQVVMTMLKGFGIEPLLVVDGAEAASAVLTERFDLILMDYHMPKLDGSGATIAIRSYENEKGWRRTPIIALSASVLSEDRARCHEAGMDDFLAKPLRSQSSSAPVVLSRTL